MRTKWEIVIVCYWFLLMMMMVIILITWFLNICWSNFTSKWIVWRLETMKYQCKLDNCCIANPILFVVGRYSLQRVVRCRWLTSEAERRWKTMVMLSTLTAADSSSSSEITHELCLELDTTGAFRQASSATRYVAYWYLRFTRFIYGNYY